MDATTLDVLSLEVLNFRRAYRRWQTYVHMGRRLKEDRNQHYNDFSCPCWGDQRAIARFKESPKRCSCPMCGNPRRFKIVVVKIKVEDGQTLLRRRYRSNKDRLTLAERRAEYLAHDEF